MCVGGALDCKCEWLVLQSGSEVVLPDRAASAVVKNTSETWLLLLSNQQLLPVRAFFLSSSVDLHLITSENNRPCPAPLPITLALMIGCYNWVHTRDKRLSMIRFFWCGKSNLVVNEEKVVVCQAWCSLSRWSKFFCAYLKLRIELCIAS